MLKAKLLIIGIGVLLCIMALLSMGVVDSLLENKIFWLCIAGVTLVGFLLTALVAIESDRDNT